MEPYGEPKHPKTAAEMYEDMLKMLQEALRTGRHAILITMEGVSEELIDVKYGVMNLDQHAKGLVMLAFAAAQMNRRSSSNVEQDIAEFSDYLRRMVE